MSYRKTLVSSVLLILTTCAASASTVHTKIDFCIAGRCVAGPGDEDWQIDWKKQTFVWKARTLKFGKVTFQNVPTPSQEVLSSRPEEDIVVVHDHTLTFVRKTDATFKDGPIHTVRAKYKMTYIFQFNEDGSCRSVDFSVVADTVNAYSTNKQCSGSVDFSR